MKTLTQIRNTETNVTITIDTTASKAEQFRQVALKGCDLGKTSFNNILSGKTQTAKGWILEVVEVESKPAKKALPLGITLGEVATAAKASRAPRARRDMTKVFEAARKGKQKEMVNALEAAGFNLCDVEKNNRWFCFNLRNVEVARKNARIDISPLKNGGMNFSLYINDRAVGKKVSLEAGKVNLETILETAKSFQA